MDKRTILAVVLSLAVLFTYQMFFAKPPVPPKAVPVQETKQASVDTAVKQPQPTPAVVVSKPAVKKVAINKEGPPRDIRVETGKYTAVFSTRGAALKSFQPW